MDTLPNGPRDFATVEVFLAGGVPEVMLRLATSGTLRLDARTVSGRTVGENLEWWESSERRARMREQLERSAIDPDDVIRVHAAHALPSTTSFVFGDLAPEGAIVKSTAIGAGLLDDTGVYRHEGPARVFTSEGAAIEAIKQRAVRPGDVLVLIGLEPSAGFPETYQVTAALKHVDDGGRIPLVTDGRFSGVSTGPCIGHVSPEAAAGGPIGKVRDGDRVRIEIDTRALRGSVGVAGVDLAAREPHPGLGSDPDVPADTRLWAALQAVGGGTWSGCVYDVERIVEARLCAPLAPAPLVTATLHGGRRAVRKEVCAHG